MLSRTRWRYPAQWLLHAVIIAELMIALGSPASAELLNAGTHPATPHSINAAIENAIATIDVDRLPNVETTEKNVVQAIEDARTYFESATEASNFDDWMRYLDWQPLVDAINQQAKVSARGRAAIALRNRLIGPEEGLELSRLVQLRSALDEYVAALLFGDARRGRAAANSFLNRIAEQFATSGDEESSGEYQVSDLSPAAVAIVDDLLSQLDRINQASELIDGIRARFSQPNVRIWVDGNVVTNAVMGPVDEASPVNDCILGTRLIGQSHLRGAVSASLIPHNGDARIWLRMDANFRSDTRGYNGPVSVDSQAQGRVYVSRQVAITERQIVLGDIISDVDFESRIRRVNHPLRLVRKIAGRNAQETRPKAEAIAGSRLRTRVEKSFRTETDRAGKREFPDLDAIMRPWLRRLDMPRPERVISSQSDSVHVHIQMQQPVGLAAPTQPPDVSTLMPAMAQPPEAVLQVHETILANSVGAFLSGLTFTPDDLDQLTSLFDDSDSGDSESGIGTRDVPATEGDDEGFEVDFEKVRPIYFEARNGTLRLGVRGSRFSQGKRELDRSLEVAATYRPVVMDDQTMMLVRDAEIDLSFPGTKRLTLTQTAIKANIIDGFSELFPETLLGRSASVPSTLALKMIAGKTYRVVGLDMSGGWFSVGVSAIDADDPN
ncbi:MAG: hypothetical protein AAF539_00890 [Planctomycetota bacterium]